MNRLAPVFGILILICLLAVLSKNINPNADKDDEAKPPPSAPATPSKPLTASDPIAPEISIGSPAAAKYHIQVGWVYDEHNQPDPASLQAALSEAQKFAQGRPADTALEIVNLDTPAEELSPAAQQVTELGVSVNGAFVSNENPGEGGLVPGQIGAKLTAAIAKP